MRASMDMEVHTEHEHGFAKAGLSFAWTYAHRGERLEAFLGKHDIVLGRCEFYDTAAALLKRLVAVGGAYRDAIREGDLTYPHDGDIAKLVPKETRCCLCTRPIPYLLQDRPAPTPAEPDETDEVREEREHENAVRYALGGIVEHNHLLPPGMNINGWAHQGCNMKKTMPANLLCFFHNGMRYDAPGHLLRPLRTQLKGVAEIQTAHSLMRSADEYLRIAIGRPKDEGLSCLVIADSLKYFPPPGSLGALAESNLAGCYTDLRLDHAKVAAAFPTMCRRFGVKVLPLLQKGWFGYHLYRSREEAMGMGFPTWEQVVASEPATERGSNPKDWAHGKRVYEAFGCANYEEYMSLYLETDVLLLQDCLMSYRAKLYGEFRLDLFQSITASSYGLQAYLCGNFDAPETQAKSTAKTPVLLGPKAKPEKPDVWAPFTHPVPEVHNGIIARMPPLTRQHSIFVTATSLREGGKELYDTLKRYQNGGLCSVLARRHAKANNPLFADFDPKARIVYLLEADKTSMYPHAMCDPQMPTSGGRLNMRKDTEPPRSGWMTMLRAIERDGEVKCLLARVSYPAAYKARFSDWPRFTTKRSVDESELSDAQRDLLAARETKGKRGVKLIADMTTKEVAASPSTLIEFVEEGGCIEAVLGSIRWKTQDESPYKRFVDFCVAKRIAARAIGDETLATAIKTCMNSVYGKTLQRTSLKACAYRTYRPGKPGYRKAMKSDQLMDAEVHADGPDDAHKSVTCALLAEAVKMTENPLQGFFVLMRSKELFQRWWHGEMKAAFGDQLVAMYTDTDSVHFAFRETEAAWEARVAALEAGTPHAPYFNAYEALKDHPTLSKTIDWSTCAGMRRANGTPLCTTEDMAREGTLGLMKLECEYKRLGGVIREKSFLASKAYQTVAGGKLNPAYFHPDHLDKDGCVATKVTNKGKGCPGRLLEETMYPACLKGEQAPVAKFGTFKRDYERVWSTEMKRQALPVFDDKRKWIPGTYETEPLGM